MCMGGLLLTAGCIVARMDVEPPTILWHQGHEEYVVKNHLSYTPQGRLVPDGTPMVCWVTGKPIGVGDLRRDGRRVYAD